jgi:hypothetical protein
MVCILLSNGIRRSNREVHHMTKTAPEIIAFHLGWDMADVVDGRYQRHASPGVYVCGNDYFCCPTHRQRLPKGFDWIEVGNHYSRAVFRAVSA